MKIVGANLRLSVCQLASGQGKTTYKKHCPRTSCEADDLARWNEKSEHDGNSFLSLGKRTWIAFHS